MGGSLLLTLAKGEMRKLRTLLEGEEETQVTAVIDLGLKEDMRVSVWLVLNGNNTVRVTYSHGGYNSGFADAIGASLMTKLKVKRWGWESVGYVSAIEARRSPLRALGGQLDAVEASVKLYGNAARGHLRALERASTALRKAADDYVNKLWERAE